MGTWRRASVRGAFQPAVPAKGAELITIWRATARMPVNFAWDTERSETERLLR